ncbi:hypothetical protein ABPG72_003767 [Tetrahymena utriculariae]
MNTKIIILLVALCAFASAQAAPGSRIKYEMYIESLCPDCMNFIEKSVTPAINVQNFLEIADLTFYPYGNAKRDAQTGAVTCQHGANECYGNKIEACGAKYLTQNLQYFKLLACIEKNIKTYSGNFDKVLTVCGQDKSVKLTQDQVNSISQCANNSEGDDLIAVIADKTDSLVPAHKYVPWVVVNGVHDTDVENAVIDNMLKYTCQNYTGPIRLPECARYQTEEVEQKLAELIKYLRFGNKN